MENAKASPGRRILNVILLLVNIALIAWIAVSWRNQDKPRPAAGENPSAGWSGGTALDAAPSNGGASPETASAGSAGAASGSDGSDNWILNGGSGGGTSASYDTTERPTPEEMDSWKQTIGYLPPDARDITDFDGMKGSWKGFIQYDMAEEMVNVTVSGAPSSLTMTVDWYRIRYSGDGVWESEEDMEDTAMTGSWTNGSMTVTGAGNIAFYAAFESGGRQAAFGEWSLPDGSTALIGLVRP